MTSDKAIVTCALTGVLTNPKQHPVPVTPEQLAVAARQARDAGAAIVHVHFRNQEPDLGYLPSWDPAVAKAVSDAIKAECPDLLFNMSTGVVGDDISGPVACMQAIRPEIAACNAGSLNYLKARSDGSWAWPPMLFDNPVTKVQAFLEAMKANGTEPEFECFDLGIVRSVGLFVDVEAPGGRPRWTRPQPRTLAAPRKLLAPPSAVYLSEIGVANTASAVTAPRPGAACAVVGAAAMARPSRVAGRMTVREQRDMAYERRPSWRWIGRRPGGAAAKAQAAEGN